MSPLGKAIARVDAAKLDVRYRRRETIHLFGGYTDAVGIAAYLRDAHMQQAMGWPALRLRQIGRRAVWCVEYTEECVS